jgi:hypothetical protein
MTIFFPQGISQFAEGGVSIKRLQVNFNGSFLLLRLIRLIFSEIPAAG